MNKDMIELKEKINVFGNEVELHLASSYRLDCGMGEIAHSVEELEYLYSYNKTKKAIFKNLLLPYTYILFDCINEHKQEIDNINKSPIDRFIFGLFDTFGLSLGKKHHRQQINNLKLEIGLSIFEDLERFRNKYINYYTILKRYNLDKYLPKNFIWMFTVKEKTLKNIVNKQLKSILSNNQPNDN